MTDMLLPLQVKFMGTRDKAADLDFSGILEEETEAGLKAAAQISMGTEVSAEDLENIVALCDQVAACPLLAALLPASLAPITADFVSGARSCFRTSSLTRCSLFGMGVLRCDPLST